MDWFAELPGVDVAAGVVLLLALARGARIGAIREAFSLAAVAAALIAARLGTAPAAAWLVDNAPLEVAPWAATGLAAGGLVLGTLIAVGLAGRAFQAGLRVAGLGLLDRAAGAALGAGEGALVVGVAVAIAAATLGSDHETLRGTRVLSAYQVATEWAGGDRLEDVAAPPLEVRR